MRISVALLLTLLFTGPLDAQTRGPVSAAEESGISWRPFFLASGEWFAANQTFDTVFGARSLRPFWGGGVQIGLRRGLFVEVAVSRFSATGQRAFVANGQAFSLGIPLTAAMTPFEATAGYRYQLTKVIAPYVGVGAGWYPYSESSRFNDADENVAKGHAGLIVMGGAEFRVYRWVGVGADAEYRRITGILGVAGISQAFGEDNLGGTAVRLKVLIGP